MTREITNIKVAWTEDVGTRATQERNGETMTTYYLIIECDSQMYEAGEIVARCDAKSRRQALRIFKMDENSQDYCVPESRLADNLYDPRLLRRITKAEAAQ